MEQKRTGSEKWYNPNNLTHEGRISMIADDILKGMEKNAILDKYVQMWEINYVNCNALYRNAISYIYKKTEINVEEIKLANLERLDSIIDNGNTSTRDVLKAIDLTAKMCGMYEQNVNIKTDDTIKFDIGLDK